MKLNQHRHYLLLTGILVIGIALRFGNLDFKPLWLDEIISALFASGLRYEAIPVDVPFPLSQIPSLFTYQSGRSCAYIAESLATQSTHPPLFFCLLYSWMGWLEPFNLSLAWKLRALPAILGCVAIAALYYLNRLAFSPRAGLFGAAIFAVSPFGVYLSQEARHYTLALLLIILALIGLIQIQRDIQQQQQRWLIWVYWAVVNSLGCYVHYFYLIALAAQIGTLGVIFYRYRRRLSRYHLITAILAIAAIALSYLPWMPILLSHFGSSRTSWLPGPDHILPLVQMVLAWLVMVIALPVENQPLWIQIPAITIGIAFFIGLSWESYLGLKQQWRDRSNTSSIVILGSFLGFVLLQFLIIVYLLGKDITIAIRYNFIYYPTLPALIGTALATRYPKTPFSRESIKPLIIISVGILSSLIVVSGLAFEKAYKPSEVAQNLNQSPPSTLIVMAYLNTTDIALELSYLYTLAQYRNHPQSTTVIFLSALDSYDSVWQTLSELSLSPVDLWLIAPGLKRNQYPEQLNLTSTTECHLNPEEHYRVGVSYQGYRCQS